MTTMTQTPGILPSWMVLVPVGIVLVLLIIWLIKGDQGTSEAEPWEEFIDEDDYTLTPPTTIYSTDLHPRMLHNTEATAEDVRESVIALWNEGGGWIPGVAYLDLAYVLGVDPDRLTHYNPRTGRHHGVDQP